MYQLKLSLLVICLSLATTSVSATKETVGWVEKVRIHPGGIDLKAKIDSGARTSSLHCDCAKPVKRNGEEWIVFTVTNHKGDQIRLERRVEKISKVKRHFGKIQRRYVISLGICLGKTYKETPVNLVDRSSMNYQLLIGRRFLKDIYIIDPALTFVSKPRCKETRPIR